MPSSISTPESRRPICTRAQHAGEHHFVDAAQMTDPEDLALHFAEPDAERNVETFQYLQARAIRRRRLRVRERRQRVRVLARIARENLEPPTSDRASRRFREARVPRERIFEPLFVQHRAALRAARKTSASASVYG